MLCGVRLGGTMKSFSFNSIVPTLVIYHCRRANEWIVTTNHAYVENLPLKVGLLLFILPAATARWLLAWEKDVCQRAHNTVR